jgi:hypothetical protein
MRLSLLLGLGILAYLFFAATQQIVGDTRASHSNSQSFYLEQSEGMRSLDTGVFTANRSRDVVARRADGTTVHGESRGADADHRLRFHDVAQPAVRGDRCCRR